MPSHDPTLCREQLATLMAEQNAQLAALESLLTQEYELLQTRDVEGLEKAGTARQQCIGHILRIEDERRALCRATGRSDDHGRAAQPARLVRPHRAAAAGDAGIPRAHPALPRTKRSQRHPGQRQTAVSRHQCARCGARKADLRARQRREPRLRPQAHHARLSRPRSLPQSCLSCFSQLSSAVAVVFIWANSVSRALNCLK